ncbi:MAG TPA: hypothetical protein VLD39_07265 [Gammaproteobacteria bacterium]|nr:hypothetical protein [Gammaproteobacteria bacterium]
MIVSSVARLVALSLVSASVLSACGGEDGGSAPVDVTVADVGFQTPESVLHDAVDDVYLVSNINGSPSDKDGNGFISRLAPSGEVIDLRWIDGAAAGTTLNAPKGMAIAGDRLYVADIDCIRIFERATGAPAGERCVEGSSFLNDVATANGGGILFTDSGLTSSFAPSGTDAVYRLDGDELATVIMNAALGAPNGVIDTAEGVLVVTFMSGEVYRIAPDGTRSMLSSRSERQLDGVVELADGRVLMSSWGDSCIYEMSADGTMTCIIPDVAAPADIGVDLGRSRVLVPLFNANAVMIRSVP